MPLVSLVDMIFKWAPETIGPSLFIMLKGMLGIFSVIVVIWIFVAILNRATKEKPAKEEEK